MPSIVWLFKDEEGFEDYAQSEEEREHLLAIYQASNTPFSIVTIEDNDHCS